MKHPAITLSAVALYLEEPHVCPACRALEIEAVESPKIDDATTVSQRNRCHLCGFQWCDVYRLVGLQEIEGGGDELLTPGTEWRPPSALRQAAEAALYWMVEESKHPGALSPDDHIRALIAALQKER